MASTVSSRPEYRGSPPPAAVQRMTPADVLVPHSIDYERHPAYSEFTRAGPLSRLSAMALFLSKFAVLAAKRAVRYEMIPRRYRSPRSLADRLAFVRAAAANMLQPHGAQRQDPAGPPLARSLADDGIVVMEMPATRYAELSALAEAHFERLARRRGASAGGREFDESRAAADPRDDAALYDFLASLFEESGILDAAEAYVGRKVGLIDVNPQINDVSDTFWEDIFPDLPERRLPGTAYFHRDASGGDLKAIVYCSDVGPTNGPFTYAVGSNRLAISRTDDLLREANDHNGLSSTDPVARRIFAALPRRWRQKGSFGNDLADGTELSRSILASAWEVTGDVGSIVVFDTKGIHRGGMVREGERRVITCVIG